MNSLDLVKSQLKDARETFVGTVEDLTQDMLEVKPGGIALPIGAVYAHLVYSEDLVIQGLLRHIPALYTTSFAGKAGAQPDMPDFMQPEWPIKHAAWAQSAQFNLSQLEAYAQAVYAATDKYISALAEPDLEKEIQIGDGAGAKSLASILTNYVILHYATEAGEISALKGMQGKKGYAF